MAIQLTSDQVWQEIEKNLFAVLGMVTPKGEARTVGIVYVVHGRKLYIGSQKETWKVKHIRQNPHVSLTVTLAKRVPLLSWIKVPAATITFAGEAKVLENNEVAPAVLKALYRDVVKDERMMAASCVIEVTPQGEFLTYGVGVSLMQMRFPEKARGHAPVVSSK